MKRSTARRASPVMARPCQEAQHRGRPLHGSPEGSYPDDPIRRCSPCKGHAIPCGLRLVLDHLGSSESIYIALLDHQLSLRVFGIKSWKFGAAFYCGGYLAASCHTIATRSNHHKQRQFETDSKHHAQGSTSVRGQDNCLDVPAAYRVRAPLALDPGEGQATYS